MKQIFNRIKNIVKANSIPSDYKSKDYDFDYEDNLKKLIDELNSEKEYNKKHNYSKQDIDLSKAYEILGVKPDSDFETIKSTYKLRQKEYHPDRVASLGSELRDLAERKTKEINEAFNLIKKSHGY